MATSEAATDLGHSRRQVARNSIAGAISLAITMVVGILYTPFMLRSLGPTVYGLVPLVSSLTTYMTIVTASVAGMVGRNITTELARGDLERASRQFNTFFRVGLLMAGALLTVCLGFSFFLPFVFNIPAAQSQATQVLFVCISFSFLLSVVGTTFESAIWARNRLDLRSTVEAVGLLIRNGLVVALFAWFQPALWCVSLGAVVSALFSFTTNARIGRALMPDLRLRRGNKMDPAVLKGIWSTSRWLFILQLGSLLVMNVDLIMVNLLLGPGLVGSYAPLVQWMFILRALVSVATGVLGPPMVALYARGELDTLTALSIRSLKLIALLIALPVGLLVGFSEPILRAWLGREFAPPSALTWIMLIPLVVEATAAPMFLIGLAADRVRQWAIATVIAGAACVPLAWTLVRLFHWDLFGVVTAVALVSLARTGIFASVFTARLLRQPWRRYFGLPVGPVVLFCLAEAIGAHFIAGGLSLDSLARIAVAGGLTGLAAAALAWVLVLTPDDRRELLQLARRVLPS